jgi:hypothetical protein
LQNAAAMRIAAVLALAACAGTNHSPDTAAPAAPKLRMTVEPIPEIATSQSVPAPVPAPEPITADVHVAVVELVRTTTLVKSPAPDADKVGVIKSGARAAVRSTAPGDDTCPLGYVELAPRGWTCGDAVTSTTEPPSQPVAHALTDDPAPDDRRNVPGSYATIRRSANAIAYDSADDARAGSGRALVGSNSIRVTGSVTVDGTKYLKTSRGDLIEAHAIRRFSPSRFRGVALAFGDPMPAWARSHHDPKKPVITRAGPSPRARKTGELAPRTVITIDETSTDGRFVRTGDDWIARADLRVATVTEPPDSAGDDEHWLDIDLDEQVLVAYEGITPVYATLVSTGKRGHRTPQRVARIKSKRERATMANDDGEIYSVADVPWTMYYHAGFALHTAYWHDGFGGTRSHGCINLAPHDARVLYHWSSPDIPPGWIAVFGDDDNPGSLVRVRSHSHRNKQRS